MRRAVAATCLVTALGCVSLHGPKDVPPGDGPLVGLYRAAIADASGTVRHVKLLLWAGPPDRLHAELLSPFGAVRFVLDAGGGAACVVDLAQSIAYSGPAGPQAVEGLVGLPVSIEDAVGALLLGTTPEGLRVERHGGAAGDLPDQFVIADNHRTLELTRVRLDRGGTSSATIGTGRAPPGMTERPLDQLPAASGMAGVGSGAER